MRVLHETEKPRPRVFAGLFKALPRRTFSLLPDRVSADAVYCQLSLIFRKPTGMGGVVW